MSNNAVHNGGHSSTTQPMSGDGETQPIQTVTPLPTLQILCVFMARLSALIAGLVIYPFINQLIKEIGIAKGNPARSGYYAGIMESTFFFSEALTVIPWGYFSDKYGRRPNLLIGPIGIIVASLAFGSSSTFLGLLISRIFLGVFNGCIGVFRSVLAEITDSTNRGDAYAFIPLISGLGQLIGPLIGGILSHPEDRWPDTLGHISYLGAHPYFLPCAISALSSLVSFAFSFAYLKESLPALVARDKHKRWADFQAGDTEQTPLLHQEEDIAAQHVPAPTRPAVRDILVRPLVAALINLFCVSYMGMCQFAILPLFYSTPIHLGGLGLTPSKIGIIMSVCGCCNAVIQLKFLGPLIRRFGAKNVFTVCFKAVFVGFTMYPILTYFAKRAGKVDGLVVMLMVILQACDIPRSMAYASIEIVIVENIPKGGPIGTVNGIAQMLTAGSRVISPIFASSLFSISIHHGLLGGNMVYLVLMGLSLVGIYCSSFLHTPTTHTDGSS